MKPKSISLVVLLLVLASAAPISSQNPPAQTSDADHARHSVAINLLRAINTAEVTYKFKHGGAYATWEVPVGSEAFDGSRVIAGLAHFDPQLVNAQFSTTSEILPGWTLRLNLTADAQAYDALLQDATRNPCGYAAVTDERGVIWQAKTIDCEI